MLHTMKLHPFLLLLFIITFFFTEKDSAQANEKKPHKKQAKTSQEVNKLD